jgi:asparagine synthase (glutamine-hydrolysing)
MWIDSRGKVGLGHRRLSIIDLSTVANQPMSNEDGSIQVVFNGEIYNHAEIRAELEAIGGHTWKTDHSDTEVIIHAYEQWGIECLHKFRGMFGIALWDGRTRALWLIRDRLGIKPVYYSHHHGRSRSRPEIKALLADPQQRRAVDEKASITTLVHDVSGAAHAVRRHQETAAGHVVAHFGKRAHQERRFWDVWEHAHRSPACLTTTSPRACSMSCAPPSSSAKSVTSRSACSSRRYRLEHERTPVLQKGESRPVRTFSIGYEGEYEQLQERAPLRAQGGRFVGAEHKERLLTIDDLLNFLPRMVELQDEPARRPGVRPGLLRV